MNKSSVQRRLKNPYLLISIILIGAWIGTFQANIRKPLPEGISISGPIRYPDRFEFLSDLTYQRSGETAMDQEIFDRILAMIDAAQTFVVIDMFLFNDEHGGERAYRPLTQEITELLIRKKQEDPNFHITFITDEINNFYGSYTAEHLSRLERHGIQVITTDLNRLRDSNPLYSSFWRMGPQWLGTRGSGFLPHPLSSTGTNVTARSYLRLLNFKANHRKVVVTDRECLVTSANPHDASSFHSNIAFYSTG
ncbi:MAG: phospholipase, partial [Gemmatimonadota bacterium]|nr:phospholipase [Gemmatimonadota bacterium]